MITFYVGYDVVTVHLKFVHIYFLEVEFSFTVSQEDHHVFSKPQPRIGTQTSGQVSLQLTLQRRRRRLKERVRVSPQEVGREVERRRQTSAPRQRDGRDFHFFVVVVVLRRRVGGRDGLQEGGQTLRGLQRVQRRRRRRRRWGRTLRRKLQQVRPS